MLIFCSVGSFGSFSARFVAEKTEEKEKQNLNILFYVLLHLGFRNLKNLHQLS